MPGGRNKRYKLALRNDNESQAWIVDGGLQPHNPLGNRGDFLCVMGNIDIFIRSYSNIMAAEKKPRQLPEFYFRVKIGGQEAIFEETMGLMVDDELPEFHRTERVSTMNVPGLKKRGSVTLKNGVFKDDDAFYAWLKAILDENAEPKQVTITLTAASGGPSITWTLNNARPTKIFENDPRLTDVEMVIETLEIAHEGIITHRP